MTEPLPGGYTSAELTVLIAQARTELDLGDHEPHQLLRGHTNAVVRLGPIVLKIARKGTPAATVERTVALVRWLQGHDFPTVPLHPGLQPLHLDHGALATVWTHYPQPPEPVTAADLAAPLAALHRLPAPPVPVRPLDNLAAIRRSLTAIDTLDTDDLAFLSDRADQLEHALADVEYTLAPGVVQGDPQHRNALHDPAGGRTVLCDWDTIAHGQPEWDLATIEIHCRRFGHGTRHWSDFTAAYGLDITTWPGHGTLRDIRELRMITTNARKAAHTPGTISEVQRRIKGLRGDEHGLPWNIL